MFYRDKEKKLSLQNVWKKILTLEKNFKYMIGFMIEFIFVFHDWIQSWNTKMPKSPKVTMDELFKIIII